MNTQEREAYINAACKYYWILSVLKGTTYYRDVVKYTLNRMDNVLLEIHVIDSYRSLKTELCLQFVNRRDKYIKNRESHKEQKTADKQFYRFLRATGYTIDVQTIKFPIRRLIKIYSVYFKDLGKMKRDLDKAGNSPYIG
jgi:hypothetical protein